MAKAPKTVFFCRECGYESVKWMGQCPACRNWNTFTEEKMVTKRTASGPKTGGGRAVPRRITEVEAETDKRTGTGISELDRVLGGGIVRGSMILIGGDPGIGKSTLLLQMCRNLSKEGRRVLYISGEESMQQIRMRADRIGSMNDSLLLLTETSLGDIREVISAEKPEICIIDSIQTMYSEEITSAPGSVSQVREATAILLQLAKSLGITIFIVGHVTKDGAVAGPRVLEHMVDTVLYFEGDRHAAYRILRAGKNRFGSTNEIGVFEMRDTGLEEVSNPSEYMLSGKPEHATGSVVACSMEGTRPVLIEIQALVVHSSFGIPRRTAVGTDFNRVNLLIAVLERRCRINLGESDAYVNIAGGIRMTEPAVDLGIALALVSAHKDIPVQDDVLVFGEIGLSGELRAVSGAEQRVMEAKKLGFRKVILPSANMKPLKKISGIELQPVSTLAEAIRAAGL